jgi:transketolase
MGAPVKNEPGATAVASRDAFGDTLARLGETHPELVVLEADLSESTRSKKFAKKYPDRFFQMGIAEANMLGVAAGLSLAGKVPFCCSFACFVTSRFDQVRMSVCYSATNVRVVGSHAGVGIGEDGYSQMGLEDIALMRSIPTMTVIQPADDLETAGAVEALLTHKGPAFLRTTRQKLDRVNKEGYKFELGKGVTLVDGKDLTIVATGGTVGPAVKAAALLATDGVSARVINIHTIKPIDVPLLAKAARETKRILTVEDHQITGGLGGAVCEALAEVEPVRIRRHGILDVFGESGTPEGLYKHFKLDADGIAGVAPAFVAGPCSGRGAQPAALRLAIGAEPGGRRAAAGAVVKTAPRAAHRRARGVDEAAVHAASVVASNRGIARVRPAHPGAARVHVGIDERGVVGEDTRADRRVRSDECHQRSRAGQLCPTAGAVLLAHTGRAGDREIVACDRPARRGTGAFIGLARRLLLRYGRPAMGIVASRRERRDGDDQRERRHFEDRAAGSVHDFPFLDRRRTKQLRCRGGQPGLPGSFRGTGRSAVNLVGHRANTIQSLQRHP